MARNRLKLTQEQLAEKLGVSDKAVSGWERDEYPPESERFPALRRELKVTYAWLHEGGGEPPAPDDPDVLMEDLAPAERAAVKAMIEAFQRRRGEVA